MEKSMILQVKIEVPSLNQTGGFTKLFDRKIEVDSLEGISYKSLVDSLLTLFPDENTIINFTLFT